MTPANQVLAVVDYDQFQSVAREVLGELQAIKANGKSSSSRRSSASTPRYQRSTSPGHRRSSSAVKRWRLMPARWDSRDVSPEGKYEILGSTTLESIAPFWKR